MAARKLTYRQIADLLLDLECGTTGFAAAASYGISPAAVSLWKPYVGLDEKWLAHVKRLEHETTLLRRRATYADGLSRIAGSIKQHLAHNSRQRSPLRQDHRNEKHLYPARAKHLC